ncbi:unnamed protein product [Gongylonema pulchrum]|uniref:Transmembrane protein n=1 Tax=Gongylonema pulchrum TaxID=637853 RepID=A0A183DWQ3_9BILA|nr:unnamed protein product [Gongylonema pulchrum]
MVENQASDRPISKLCGEIVKAAETVTSHIVRELDCELQLGQQFQTKANASGLPLDVLDAILAVAFQSVATTVFDVVKSYFKIDANELSFTASAITYVTVLVDIATLLSLRLKAFQKLMTVLPILLVMSGNLSERMRMNSFLSVLSSLLFLRVSLSLNFNALIIDAVKNNAEISENERCFLVTVTAETKSIVDVDSDVVAFSHKMGNEKLLFITFSVLAAVLLTIVMCRSEMNPSAHPGIVVVAIVLIDVDVAAVFEWFGKMNAEKHHGRVADAATSFDTVTSYAKTNPYAMLLTVFVLAVAFAAAIAVEHKFLGADAVASAVILVKHYAKNMNGILLISYFLVASKDVAVVSVIKCCQVPVGNYPPLFVATIVLVTVLQYVAATAVNANALPIVIGAVVYVDVVTVVIVVAKRFAPINFDELFLIVVVAIVEEEFVADADIDFAIFSRNVVEDKRRYTASVVLVAAVMYSENTNRPGPPFIVIVLIDIIAVDVMKLTDVIGRRILLIVAVALFVWAVASDVAAFAGDGVKYIFRASFNIWMKFVVAALAFHVAVSILFPLSNSDKVEIHLIFPLPWFLLLTLLSWDTTPLVATKHQVGPIGKDLSFLVVATHVDVFQNIISDTVVARVVRYVDELNVTEIRLISIWVVFVVVS